MNKKFDRTFFNFQFQQRFLNWILCKLNENNISSIAYTVHIKVWLYY